MRCEIGKKKRISKKVKTKRMNAKENCQGEEKNYEGRLLDS